MLPKIWNFQLLISSSFAKAHEKPVGGSFWPPPPPPTIGLIAEKLLFDISHIFLKFRMDHMCCRPRYADMLIWITGLMYSVVFGCLTPTYIIYWVYNIVLCQGKLLSANCKENTGRARCVASKTGLLPVLLPSSTSVLASANFCHPIHDCNDWNQLVISKQHTLLTGFYFWPLPWKCVRSSRSSAFRR